MGNLKKFSIELPEEKQVNPYIVALRYSLINVFGSFVSILAVAITILFKTADWPEFKYLIRNGEIIIICIALIISAMYTLGENLRHKNSASIFLFWSCFVILIIAVLVYASNIDKQLVVSNTNLEIQEKIFPYIKWTSIFLFIWTFGAVYYSQLIQLKNHLSSAFQNRSNDFNELKSDLEQL